ncbi:hypothetical protein BH20BAC1_BH20BAC1_24470 [soil metagenome]
MNYKILFILIAIFVFTWSGILARQPEPPLSNADLPGEINDSSPVIETTFDTLLTKSGYGNYDPKFHNWKKDRDFGYVAYLDSLLKIRNDLSTDTFSIDQSTGERRRATVSRRLQSPFLNSFPFQLLFLLIAVFFIGLVLYWIFSQGRSFLQRPKRYRGDDAEAESAELDDDDAYNNFIQKAESQKDYNLSTRYLYLQTLKKLSNEGFIIFSPEKSNRTYVQELSAKTFGADFQQLTIHYEYLWYGKFLITYENYIHLKERFKIFNQKL